MVRGTSWRETPTHAKRVRGSMSKENVTSEGMTFCWFFFKFLVGPAQQWIMAVKIKIIISNQPQDEDCFFTKTCPSRGTQQSPYPSQAEPLGR